MTSTLIVGCGYLGRRVGKLLNARGDLVYGTSRKLETAETFHELGIKHIHLDVLKPETLANLPKVDRILYCVGFDRTLGIPIHEVYVEGLKRVLDAANSSNKSQNLPRLVYASSTGVYGVDDGGWVDEDTPAEPRTESGKACLEAERICQSSGFPTCILRYSGLYGPGRVMRQASLLKGEPTIGDPSKWLNLIHIDDAAMVAVKALDHAPPGSLYVATDNRPVQRSEFYGLIAKLLGAAEPTFIVPEPGSPESRREESNKRVRSKNLMKALNPDFIYPDVIPGIESLFREAP